MATEKYTKKRPVNENDRRVIKTKQVIRDSFFRLMKDKPMEKITVSDIIRSADINRSTFYFYYDDIFDMIEQINNEIFDYFNKEIVSTSFKFSGYEDYEKYIERYLVFCTENVELCRFITTNGCNNDLANRIRKSIEAVIPNSAAVFDKNESEYYLTTFAISAILYTILEWIDDQMQVPPSEMARFLTEIYVFGAGKIKMSDRFKNLPEKE